MGWWKDFRDGMNEEFILGERNIARYEADPEALDAILAEQRSRGIGSARGLREHARRGQAAAVREEDAGLGLLGTLGAIGIGLAAGLLLSGNDRERD